MGLYMHRPLEPDEVITIFLMSFPVVFVNVTVTVTRPAYPHAVSLVSTVNETGLDFAEAEMLKMPTAIVSTMAIEIKRFNIIPSSVFSL